MHIQMILRRCHGFSLSNADDSDDNDADNGPIPPSRCHMTSTVTTDASQVRPVREIGEMFEDQFYMLRGIV